MDRSFQEHKEHDRSVHQEKELDFGDIIQSLIFSGHSLSDIYGIKRDYPYQGYTYPEVKFYAMKAESVIDNLRADLLEGMTLSISAALDEKGYKALKKEVKQLRDSDA